jgi:hypothetical protein
MQHSRCGRPLACEACGEHQRVAVDMDEWPSGAYALTVHFPWTTSDRDFTCSYCGAASHHFCDFSIQNLARTLP